MKHEQQDPMVRFLDLLELKEEGNSSKKLMVSIGCNKKYNPC